MPFQKGHSGNPKGKPIGSVSILTRTVRDVVFYTFNELQQDPKTDLKAFARKFPKEFHALAAKLIPTAVHAEITAPSGIQIIFKQADECKPIGFNPDDGKDGGIHPGILGE